MAMQGGDVMETPHLEIRIGQGETPGYYWVEGWRNGQPKYVRTGNVTSHEAWSYGDAWMRDEREKERR